MATDDDAIDVNIMSVDGNTSRTAGPGWNIPDDRPDAESAPTIPLDRPAADWFTSGSSDK
jgi:hypothetical protein